MATAYLQRLTHVVRLSVRKWVFNVNEMFLVFFFIIVEARKLQRKAILKEINYNLCICRKISVVITEYIKVFHNTQLTRSCS